MIEKDLVLLTKQFPYQYKEQYVAHELEYLASVFRHVYIYPHDHFSADETPSFKLPSNVEVINLNRQIIPASKLSVILGFLMAFVYELIKSPERLWVLKNLKRSFSIYATQFALGNGLTRFLALKKVKLNQVVFYSYWFSNSALCLSILKSRGKIASFYSRAHSLDLYHEDWGLLNELILVPPFRRFKNKHVDAIYSITDHGRDYLNEKFPNQKKYFTSYLGVRDHGLNPPDSVDSNVFVIVTCSGFDENKRLHKLGEALSRINRRVHWIHFGDGVLRTSAVESIKNSLVTYDFQGQTANEQIRTFFTERHVDLFVNVSLVEGLPVTIMEALSHGVPVLATSVNGTPEAINTGSNGWLIPVNFSADQIDEVLIEIIDHPDLREKARLEARRKFESSFHAEINYSKFARILLLSNNNS